MGIARFTIEVCPPFRLDLTVWALRRRPHNTIDAWDGTTYTRTLEADASPVLVAVRQEGGESEGVRLGVEVRRRGEAPSEAGIGEVRRTQDNHPVILAPLQGLEGVRHHLPTEGVGGMGRDACDVAAGDLRRLGLVEVLLRGGEKTVGLCRIEQARDGRHPETNHRPRGQRAQQHDYDAGQPQNPFALHGVPSWPVA